MSKAAISIEGFVARELEIRNAGSHRVVEVTVPHTPSKLVDGQWVDEKEKTVWFEATFWNEHADVLLGSVQKGSFVSLTGTPELEVYTKNDGTPGAKIKIGNPQIAVIVRRPKRGEQSSQAQADQWATSAPSTGPSVDEPWNQPQGGAYGTDQDTPF